MVGKIIGRGTSQIRSFMNHLSISLSVDGCSKYNNEWDVYNEISSLALLPAFTT